MMSGSRRKINIYSLLVVINKFTIVSHNDNSRVVFLKNKLEKVKAGVHPTNVCMQVNTELCKGMRHVEITQTSFNTHHTKGQL